MAFQAGNLYGRTPRDYESAIRRSLARHGKGDAAVGLNRIASRLIIEALKGKMWAIQEIGNRIDGKPTEHLNISNPDQLSVQDMMELLHAIRAMQSERQAIDVTATTVAAIASTATPVAERSEAVATADPAAAPIVPE